jgi:transketolase-like protein/MFS transporter
VIFAVLALSGGLAAVSAAAVPALVPSLLPAGQLASANAGIGIAKDGAMALGAVGAGAALSWTGAAPALAIDLVTFAVATLLYLGIRSDAIRPRRERAAGAPGGLRYLLGRPRLLLLVCSFAAATLATGLANATFPGFFDLEIGLGAGGYGFAIAALAIGLTLGQALVGFARVGHASGRWIGAGLILMAGFFVLLALGTHLPTALLVIAAIGFVDGTTDVLFETFVQQEADPSYYGAVFGLASAWMTTTMVAAIAVAPVLADIVDPHGVILAASVFLLAAGAIALFGMRGNPTASAPVSTTDRAEVAERHAVSAPALATRLLRAGDDLTIFTWGGLVRAAHVAADLVGDTGTSIEIVDVGGPGSWDREAVLASVRKTSKALIAGNGGLDAEIAATIVERAFEDLDAPVYRLAAPELPELVASLRELAAY